ncbi:9255_t:CDS:2 [Ambispora gerdemannii]|uniref:9255_t:CDS:1 n=1 Tax=Ambispora gerdemannii TaxID=144530 RepID=A0A9N9AHA5_9GLOM|nr:9255_t:CDS:2 [Ambispora gerdemannii]
MECLHKKITKNNLFTSQQFTTMVYTNPNTGNKPTIAPKPISENVPTNNSPASANPPNEMSTQTNTKIICLLRRELWILYLIPAQHSLRQLPPQNQLLLQMLIHFCLSIRFLKGQ